MREYPIPNPFQSTKMESLANANATTSTLFNDSLNDTLLQSSNESLPSDETTSIFCHPILSNCGPMHKHPTGNGGVSFTSFLFLFFPAMGFIILVLGSFFLRTRIIREDNEAIRSRDELASATNAAEKFRRREDEIGGGGTCYDESDVFAGEESMLSMPNESRTSTSTMETNVTDELDSTNSSSCTLRGMVEMAGEESSENGIIDDDNNQRLSDAERGQQSMKISNIISKATLSPIASETVSEAQSLEGNPTTLTPPTTCDWRMETCAICLEPYKENDIVSYSKHQNCTHVFHKDCILSWLKDEMKNDCPYCRGPYLEICVAEQNDDDLGGNDDDENLTTSADIVRVVNPHGVNVTTDYVSTIGVEGSNV